MIASLHSSIYFNHDVSVTLVLNESFGCFSLVISTYVIDCHKKPGELFSCGAPWVGHRATCIVLQWF